MLSQAALHENRALGVFERSGPGEAIQKSSDRSYRRVKRKEAVKEWGIRKMETKGGMELLSSSLNTSRGQNDSSDLHAFFQY